MWLFQRIGKCWKYCVKIEEEDFIVAGLRNKILNPIIFSINPNEKSWSENDDDDDEI